MCSPYLSLCPLAPPPPLGHNKTKDISEFVPSGSSFTLQQALLDALLANGSPPNLYNAIKRSLAALAALPDGDTKLVLHKWVSGCACVFACAWCLCVCARCVLRAVRVVHRRT